MSSIPLSRNPADLNPKKMKFAEHAGIGLPEDEIRSITTGKFPLWHKKTDN